MTSNDGCHYALLNISQMVQSCNEILIGTYTRLTQRCNLAYFE